MTDKQTFNLDLNEFHFDLKSSKTGITRSYVMLEMDGMTRDDWVKWLQSNTQRPNEPKSDSSPKRRRLDSARTGNATSEAQTLINYELLSRVVYEQTDTGRVLVSRDEIRKWPWSLVNSLVEKHGELNGLAPNEDDEEGNS